MPDLSTILTLVISSIFAGIGAIYTARQKRIERDFQAQIDKAREETSKQAILSAAQERFYADQFEKLKTGLLEAQIEAKHFETLSRKFFYRLARLEAICVAKDLLPDGYEKLNFEAFELYEPK